MLPTSVLKKYKTKQKPYNFRENKLNRLLSGPSERIDKYFHNRMASIILRHSKYNTEVNLHTNYNVYSKWESAKDLYNLLESININYLCFIYRVQKLLRIFPSEIHIIAFSSIFTDLNKEDEGYSERLEEYHQMLEGLKSNPRLVVDIVNSTATMKNNNDSDTYRSESIELVVISLLPLS